MGMGSAFNIGKIFGIQLRIHYSWFIIFILVTAYLVYPNWSEPSYWIISIIASLLFFSSVVAHELAHSLVGRAQGIPIRSITLFIFGGIAHMTKEATNPGAEFKMAFAGPLASLFIGGLFGLVWVFTRNLNQPVADMMQWLAIINVALAVFNLIPGFPLDGGRVFRSILWRFTANYNRSTQIATRVGRGVGYSFILGGIVIIILTEQFISGLWLAFIGWFLENAASSSYRQLQWHNILQGLPASQVMQTSFPIISSSITLSELVRTHVMPSGYTFFIVIDQGKLTGIVTLNNIKSVPQEDWDMTRVSGIMTPLEQLKVAYPEQDVMSLFEQMNTSDINQVPVLSEGKVLGVVTRDSLLRLLRARTELRLRISR